MLCCLIAALLASPALLWPALRRPACCALGVRALPLALVGVAFLVGMTLLCLVVFTSSGAATFRHICSIAAWRARD